MPSVRPRTVEVTKRSTVVLVWNPARGRWVRGHHCILAVACPECGARKGRPCVGPRGERGETHYRRRDAARKQTP